MSTTCFAFIYILYQLIHQAFDVSKFSHSLLIQCRLTVILVLLKNSISEDSLLTMTMGGDAASNMYTAELLCMLRSDADSKDSSLCGKAASSVCSSAGHMGVHE